MILITLTNTFLCPIFIFGAQILYLSFRMTRSLHKYTNINTHYDDQIKLIKPILSEKKIKLSLLDQENHIMLIRRT